MPSCEGGAPAALIPDHAPAARWTHEPAAGASPPAEPSGDEPASGDAPPSGDEPVSGGVSPSGEEPSGAAGASAREPPSLPVPGRTPPAPVQPPAIATAARNGAHIRMTNGLIASNALQANGHACGGHGRRSSVAQTA